MCISKVADPSDSTLFNPMDPLSRLMNDITQLHVEFECGTKISYIVSWPKHAEFYHPNQKVLRMKDLNYYIGSSTENIDHVKMADSLSFLQPNLFTK